jgi:hypothetical protein
VMSSCLTVRCSAHRVVAPTAELLLPAQVQGRTMRIIYSSSQNRAAAAAAAVSTCASAARVAVTVVVFPFGGGSRQE